MKKFIAICSMLCIMLNCTVAFAEPAAQENAESIEVTEQNEAYIGQSEETQTEEAPAEEVVVDEASEADAEQWEDKPKEAEQAVTAGQEEAVTEQKEGAASEQDGEVTAESENVIVEAPKLASPITEVYAMTGKLYFCDLPTERVVIKCITPMVSAPESEQVAKEAEYLEIKLAADGLRMNDGSAITINDLNIYVDSEIWFIIAKSADGNLSIPYLCFK